MFQLNKIAVTIAFWAFMVVGYVNSYASDNGIYTYFVRSGDTLSEITLMFTGNFDYHKIARVNNISNPDLIYPGDKIALPSSRPSKTLKNYLKAIYDSKELEAYKLLSTDTRSKFSFDEFNKSLSKLTFYDLNSLNVCADFIENGSHILQIKLYLEEDPASWGFNLIREKYKWYVLLFNLTSTYPQDNGFLEWKCN